MYLRIKLDDALLEFAPPATKVGDKAFTLPHLIAWLEQQDQATIYDWECCYTCLLAQYALAAGEALPHQMLVSPYHSTIDRIKVRCGLPMAQAVHEAARSVPHTYGDALARLKLIAV